MNIEKIEKFIFRVRNPQAYSGLEINRVHREFKPDQINICLVFPDTYEIGMSHQGLKILYHQLNELPGVNAERCFLPEKESLPLFNELDLELFSIENRVALKKFDIIGFSLLSEFGFTNVLQVLHLAGIPLKAAERGAAARPLIAAGGISAVNPEPLREFIDVFAVGDGEVLFPDLVEAVRQGRDHGSDRKALLAEIDKISGFYVPSLYPVEKKGEFYVPAMGNRKIRKRVLTDMNRSLPHERLIVPVGRVVFDRLDVEIARGCPQACRFCQAKNYYSPYRAKSHDHNINFIKCALSETGFDTFSLSTLSAGDYPELEKLLEQISGSVPANTSMSVSSLRPATLTDNLLKTISAYRRTNLTIVPEAGTERLRRVINKNVSDPEIFTAVDKALDFGWQKLKLYFMIGLPTESEDDMQGIVDLLEKILDRIRQRKRKVKLHLSFSSFVPKPHTALQWVSRETVASLKKKVFFLRDHLKKYRNISMDFHRLDKALVETVLARGDCRVGELLSRAFAEGETYTAWDTHFNFSVWEKLIIELGLDIFLNEIPVSQELPWDFLQIGYLPAHLKKEYKLALNEEKTGSCFETECRACGGCMFPGRIDAVLAKNVSPDPGTETAGPVPEDFRRVRLFYAKTGEFCLLSHLALMHYIEKLIRKSGIRFQCSGGFHPRIKMVSLPPLPVHASGLAEAVELNLDVRFSEKAVFDRLKAVSPGFPWIRAQACATCPALNRDVTCMEYEFRAGFPEDCEQVVKGMAGSGDEVWREGDSVILKMDYRNSGQERFARILRTLDPEKILADRLIRRGVWFRSSGSPGE